MPESVERATCFPVELCKVQYTGFQNKFYTLPVTSTNTDNISRVVASEINVGGCCPSWVYETRLRGNRQ